MSHLKLRFFSWFDILLCKHFHITIEAEHSNRALNLQSSSKNALVRMNVFFFLLSSCKSCFTSLFNVFFNRLGQIMPVVAQSCCLVTFVVFAVQWSFIFTVRKGVGRSQCSREKPICSFFFFARLFLLVPAHLLCW